jgi:Holliday junction resolvase-like predicted endonuclease
MTHLDDWLRHENLVHHTFERLQAKNRYFSLQKHVPYRVKHYSGECDILASNDKFINYYEVKGHECKQSFEHAVEQFKRFQKTHPMFVTRFIYVTPTSVRRVYL